MSFFGSQIVAKTDERSVHADARSVFLGQSAVRIVADAFDASFIAEKPLVCDVLRARRFSQVGPYVIRSIAVFMVNIANRPTSSHVKKCDPASDIFNRIKFQAPAAIPCWSTGDVSWFGFSAPTDKTDAPSKYTGVRFVSDQLLQSFYSNGLRLVSAFAAHLLSPLALMACTDHSVPALLKKGN